MYARRVVANMLLTLGILIGSMTMSGWWFRSTALDPARSERTAKAALESPEVRSAVAGLVAGAIAKQTGQDPKELQGLIDTAAAKKPDLGFLAGTVTKIHEAAVGTGPEVITFSAAELEPLIGPDLAKTASRAAVTVPVVSPLRFGREQLDKWLPTGLAMTLGLIAAAFLLHPRRSTVLRRISWWLISLTAWQVVVLWVVPGYLIPGSTKNPWALLAARVAVASATDLIPALVGLFVAGVASGIASVAWGQVADAHAHDRSMRIAGNQPGHGTVAWTAWAAHNAVNASRNRHTPKPEPATFAGFGSAHDRGSSDTDRWGM